MRILNTENLRDVIPLSSEGVALILFNYLYVDVSTSKVCRLSSRFFLLAKAENSNDFEHP